MSARNKFWTDEKHAKVRALAAEGFTASEIGDAIGATKTAVIVVAVRGGINMVLHTDAEFAAIEERARARLRRRKSKLRGDRPLSLPETSKTAPAYRNPLPRLPEMSKTALREMLAQAVRNTQGASA